MLKLTKYNKRAFLGGIIATVFIGFGAYALGNISGYEAKSLIQSSLPGMNTLCNTIVLASATILTLLLTLLSISSSTKSKLTEDHYKHVLLIAKIDTVVFVAAMIVFQLMNIPVTEADNVPNSWYSIIYYISLALSAILSGGLVSVVLMLYNTVVSIIRIVGLGEIDHPLVYKDKNEDDSKNE
jgi:membrane-associated HD superfamily phosphohydrolase|tara:strand:+ start:309 stop:857 length:549 start_codon:yes stop_codon:yes gene_type:complete